MEEIKCVRPDDEGFPKRLLNIPQPPDKIFYAGNLPDEDKIAVSVIGSRDCTSYGADMAAEIGRALSDAGIILISGLARGVDSISQRAALLNGGTTFGVLGNGVDICYPKSNKDLYDRLYKGECGGGLISELDTKTVPLKAYFPQRNRIVSGLCDALVVVEARERSGTFITVTSALEQGKDVYMVPGRLDDPLSYGCNRLIGQGAGVIYDIGVFINEMKEKALLLNMVIDAKKQAEKKPTPKQKRDMLAKLDLTDEELKVYKLLDRKPVYLDEIVYKYQKKYKADIGLTELMSILSSVEFKGYAVGDCGFYHN